MVKDKNPTRDIQHLSVGDTTIFASDRIEMLGFSCDRNMSPAPFISDLRTALAQQLDMIRRLKPPSLHLSWPWLRAIFLGKLQVYANPAFNARLSEENQKTAGADAIQVITSDVARCIVNVRRADHVRVRCLLDKVQMLSLNEIVARSSVIVGGKCQGCSTHCIGFSPMHVCPPQPG